MKEFKSWRAYWDFRRSVLSQSRYCWSVDVHDFLDTLVKTSTSRHFQLKKDTYLWRAQQGCDWRPEYAHGEYIDDLPVPYLEKRMKPLVDEASEGRANPKGIPYLYTAIQKETAMSEVRPWMGSYVTVSQFKTERDMKLVDCSKHPGKMNFFFKEPSAEKREDIVWSDIDRSFATPITNEDRKADYVPTQIIAELFKTNGFDGIAFRSSLTKGINVVLFDLNSASYVNSFLYSLKGMTFDFEEEHY